MVFNHPIAILLIAVYVFGHLRLACAFHKGWSLLCERFGVSQYGNRFLVFFGFLGYHHDYTPDVRIYRQDRLCTKYMTDKKMAYSPQGIFAAYARGPMGLLNAASATISVALTGFVYLYVCLKSWAGAFGIGAVIQYVAFVKLLAGSVSSILSTAGCAQTHRF